MYEDESELGWDRPFEQSDAGEQAETVNRKIFFDEIVRQLPLSIIFGNLTEDEKLLANLVYFNNMAPAEIAEHLGRDKKSVMRASSRLRDKIRQRSRRIIKGTSLEKELFVFLREIEAQRQKTAQVAKEAALARERIAKDREEIDLLKAETRETLRRMRAA